MSAVTFDLTTFLAMFPHIDSAYDEGKLTETQISNTFSMMADLLGNEDGESLYPYNPDEGCYKRRTFLYLATCHVLTLNLWALSGQPGRIASASQGSVSTSFDLIKTGRDSAQWWFLTPCGQQYWTLTKPYRIGGRVYITKHHHPFG